jgi:outer membrane lipoprotein-sorting protein
VIEEKRVAYRLFFADVRNILNLKGLILYIDGSGKIIKAQIKQNMTPIFLIKLVDDSMFPDESEMIMAMTDIKKGGRKRAFTFRILAVRNKASVMEFTAPKREIGKKILLKDKNLWMYSPKISRPVRLSTRQKFMGSSFSNNDLMDISLEDDYNITVEKLEMIGKQRCIKLLLKAKNNSVTYPKMEVWLNTKNLVTARIYYFTPSGKLLKKLETRKLKLLGGRERASEFVMKNMFEKENETVLELKEMHIRKISDKVFTESYLKR